MEAKILWAIFFMLASIILMNSGIDKEYRRNKRKKERLQEQRAQITGRKAGRIEKYIVSERKLVRATNTDMKTYLALLTVSLAGGWFFGKLVFIDSVISLCVAGVCIVLPHAFLIFKGNKERRAVAENLEAAMRIITHEYMNTLDIQKAVENSVDVIDMDKPFREFLVDCQLVSANMERNLRHLENKVSNIFFSRWIDQLILTQSYRSQIVNLMPILDDMNDAKTAQRENDTKTASAWRDYFTMLFIILLSPLLIRVIQYEWYNYLITTFFGRVLVVSMLGSLVWATGRAMKINKPITG